MSIFQRTVIDHLIVMSDIVIIFDNIKLYGIPILVEFVDINKVCSISRNLLHYFQVTYLRTID